MRMGWPCSICLMAFLSIAGLAWAQAGNVAQEVKEKPFLQPHAPARGYGNVDGSNKKVDDNTIKYNNINRPSKKDIPGKSKKSLKSKIGPQQKAVTPQGSVEKGATDNIMDINALSQNRSHGSGSFFDGYLLRSLKEEKLTRKKAQDDSKTNNNLLKKNK